MIAYLVVAFFVFAVYMEYILTFYKLFYEHMMKQAGLDPKQQLKNSFPHIWWLFV